MNGRAVAYRLKMVLLALSLILSIISPAFGQEGGIPDLNEYISENGLLSTAYPAGWLTVETGAADGCPGVKMANSGETFANLFSTKESGQVGIWVCVLPEDVVRTRMEITVTSDMTAADLTLALATFMFQSPGQPAAAELVPLNNDQIAGYVEWEDDLALSAYHRDDVVVMLISSTYPGEIANLRDLNLAVMGSVDFSGSSSDLITILQQRTSETGSAPETNGPDLSAMPYTEAFDELLRLMRYYYIFAQYKGIDWDQLAADYRPRFEEAEENADPQAYLQALHEFAWSLGDGHVRTSIADHMLNNGSFAPGGLGMAISELDDGRALVTFVQEDSPAGRAGIQPRAEILSVNGQEVGHVIDMTQAPGSFSTDAHRRAEQARYALRFPVGTEVEITFQNPDSAQPTSVALTAVEEHASLDASTLEKDSRYYSYDPLTIDFLDNGVVYVRINSFIADPNRIHGTWQAALRAAQESDAPGVIVDVRWAGGGNGRLVLEMASAFFSETIPIGDWLIVLDKPGEPESPPNFLPPLEIVPPAENKRYAGPVAILVGPGCISACELFAYAMTQQDRAAIVGHSPTAGAFGGIGYRIRMPEGDVFSFTTLAYADINGEILLEGSGVAPTARVPVTEETLFSDSDPVLEMALQVLAAKENEAG